MDFNFVAGAATTVALLLPVLLIVIGCLFQNGSLLALFIYYLFTAVYNLMTLDVIQLTLLEKRQAAIAVNYLDTPLMLIALLFFCNEKWKKLMVLATLAVFLIFELIIGYLFGMDIKSSTYLLGPGTLVVLSFAIFFFVHYGKSTIVHGKNTGKTLMLVAILFSYGSFLLLYYLNYLIRTKAIDDVFLMYYISVFISAVIMSIGLVSIIKRNREIQELQTTRKELALFFNK